MHRLKRMWIVVIVATVVLAVIVALMWPVATWLQRRESWLNAASRPDAVYLVAGSREQDRRIDGVVSCLADRHVGDEGVEKRTNSPALILIGNDELRSGWSRDKQANLTQAEWAVKKIEREPALQQMLKSGRAKIEIVPGQFSNTDGEMEALAVFLNGRPTIRTLALATSPFHFRRASRSIEKHLTGDVAVLALGIESKQSDRMPWTVVMELAKLARDAMGLSRARLLSRR